jgi:hypothetical protein
MTIEVNKIEQEVAKPGKPFKASEQFQKLTVSGFKKMFIPPYENFIWFIADSAKTHHDDDSETYMYRSPTYQYLIGSNERSKIARHKLWNRKIKNIVLEEGIGFIVVV